MSGLLAPAIVLDRYSTHTILEAINLDDHPEHEDLWRKVHRVWETRGMNNSIAVPLTKDELDTLRRLGATTRSKVVRYGFLAVYKHPETGQEVRVKTLDRPPRRKTLRVPGSGRKKFIRVKLYAIINQKESNMAKKRKKDEDEIDELDGLEELEDLEEPEDEDDEDEVVEEKPKRKTRAKKGKKKVVVEEDDEDEEDEDEEEDEDDDDEEEPAPKKRQKKGAKKGGKKSSSTDDEDEKPSKKKSKKSGKGSGTKSPGQTTKEMTGGVGSADLAEAASELADADITGRDVRVYLRREGIPKNEEHGRYVWPSTKNKEFTKLAKAIAKEFS